MDSTLPQYVQFGQAIAAARLAAGISKQVDLATLLKIKQQSVSRWEAGMSRPPLDQLPLIAEALRLNPSDLRTLAGYEVLSGQSFVAPLPLEALPPDTFEQFVTDLCQYEHPEADVRRAGTTGHKQHGLDIQALFPDGRVTDIQCKRVDQFGAAKVKAAVKDYTGSADLRVLAMSRVASPDAAAEVIANGWRLWDRDDLSRRLRNLPGEIQDRMVDRYFRGRRLELLGRPEPGPWKTAEEFFRPYEGKPVFNHDAALIGRDDEIAAVFAALQAPQNILTLLIAPGGMGKSRLIKEMAPRFQQWEPATRIWFLSASSEATWTALEALGAGPKILVVDDAHDRDHLTIILEYAADPSRQCRVLFATRPYAVARLKGEGASVGLSSPTEVQLQQLSVEKLRELCRSALITAGAPIEWASEIVKAAGNSPLIATMAARVIAKSGVPPELAKGDLALRQTVMGKFTDILTGEIGGRGEQTNIRRTLELLALIQPFSMDGQEIKNLLKTVYGLSEVDAAAALKRLVDGGVILKRGMEWRLVPDVLGDYLIETVCLDAVGKLSPFAEQVLAAVLDSATLTNVLVNLGRMDWRLNEGDTTKSALLATVWRRFDDLTEPFDYRLDPIKAVAIFQPRQVLDFITRALGRAVNLRAFAELLRSIVFSGRYVDEALKLLWDLGQEDDRNLGQATDHPIRVLAELGDFDERKPLKFSNDVLAFALELSKDEQHWQGRWTPLDILKQLLSLDGIHHESNGRQIVMRSFFVDYEVVKPLRQSIIGLVVSGVSNPNPKIAHACAAFVEQLLHGPMGAMSSSPPPKLYQACDREFAVTLKRLKAEIAKGIDPIAHIALARAVAWRSRHGKGKVGKLAAEILDELPTDVEFQTRAALADGHGQLFVDRSDPENWEQALTVWINGVVATIRAAKPDASARRDFIEQALRDLAAAGEAATSAHILMMNLIRDDLPFAQIVAKNALADANSYTRQFAGAALNTLLNKSREEGRAMVRSFLASGDGVLAEEAARAFGFIEGGIDDHEIAIVRELLQHDNDNVVFHTIRNIWIGQHPNPKSALDLLIGARLGKNARLADELAMALVAPRPTAAAAISKAQAQKLLEQLSSVPKMDGYWIDELLARLSFEYPFETAEFFMRRVDEVGRQETFEIRPVNHGPYSHKRLRFMESSAGSAVLKHTWAWLQANHDQNVYFHYAAADAFEAMFAFDDTTLVSFFRPLAHTAGEKDIRLMSRLLRQTQPGFVFRNQTFVVEFLTRCRAVDAKLLETVISELYGATIGGLRSGTPGIPMQRDLDDLEQAERVLRGLSRLSPAYALYEGIRASAADSIERSKQEGAAYDVMEEEVG